MRAALVPLTIAAVLSLGACGHGRGMVASSGDPLVGPATTRVADLNPSIPMLIPARTIVTTLVNGKPHFAAPEDAMTYLAAAWNADDQVSLKHVTDPSARSELDLMHGVATNLRLTNCEPHQSERGPDFLCSFAHDYPAGAEHHDSTDAATGEAIFLAGPADTPGWYMTVFVSCN